MQITKKWLEEKLACPNGIKWFEENFGLEADYQEVLDNFAKADKIGWAKWLIEMAGSLDTKLEIEGDLIADNIFFAGEIIIKGNLYAKTVIAGKTISGNIKAKPYKIQQLKSPMFV